MCTCECAHILSMVDRSDLVKVFQVWLASVSRIQRTYVGDNNRDAWRRKLSSARPLRTRRWIRPRAQFNFITGISRYPRKKQHSAIIYPPSGYIHSYHCNNLQYITVLITDVFRRRTLLKLTTRLLSILASRARARLVCVRARAIRSFRKSSTNIRYVTTTFTPAGHALAENDARGARNRSDEIARGEPAYSRLRRCKTSLESDRGQILPEERSLVHLRCGSRWDSFSYGVPRNPSPLFFGATWAETRSLASHFA